MLVFNYDPAKIKPHKTESDTKILELETKLKQLKFAA